MVLQKDDLRKDTQKILDDLKAKANADAKKIGELMKAGKADEANALRAAVATAKDKTKGIGKFAHGFGKRADRSSVQNTKRSPRKSSCRGRSRR